MEKITNQSDNWATSNKIERWWEKEGKKLKPNDYNYSKQFVW